MFRSFVCASQFATARWKFGTWLQWIGTNIQASAVFATVQTNMNYCHPHGNQLVHSVFGKIGTSCPSVPPMREFSTCCTNFLSRAGRGGRMPQMRSRIATPMTKIDAFSQWNGIAD